MTPKPLQHRYEHRPRTKLTRTEKALAKAKNRAERWREEAKALRRAASRARARVERLRQKLDGSSAALGPVQAAAPMPLVTSGGPVAEPTTVDGVTADETWRESSCCGPTLASED